MKPAWESKEKLREYQKQHRIERMQTFLKQCMVSSRRPLTTRRPQPPTSESVIASHKGHTPSQALRHVESSYNVSSGSMPTRRGSLASGKSRNLKDLKRSELVTVVKEIQRPVTHGDDHRSFNQEALLKRLFVLI